MPEPSGAARPTAVQSRSGARRWTVTETRSPRLQRAGGEISTQRADPLAVVDRDKALHDVVVLLLDVRVVEGAGLEPEQQRVYGRRRLPPERGAENVARVDGDRLPRAVVHRQRPDGVLEVDLVRLVQRVEVTRIEVVGRIRFAVGRGHGPYDL